MRIEHLRELREKGLITEHQYSTIEPIATRKVLSVFYELRILLYLGVMLFTTGVGILIYQNIGDMGHILAVISLFILTGVCFWYAFRYAPGYSNEKTKAPTPYFDYVVLLGSLLFISALTYLQIQYELFDDGLGATTLVTAAFFFYAAYRFDHPGVLSLAITALASFWGISVSPQKWYSSDFFSEGELYNIALVFGAVLATVAVVLDRRDVKRHFTFTYMNFSALIFLTGALTGVFVNADYNGLYLLLLYAGCGVVVYSGHRRKSFLFLLYAFVYAYIGTTYMLIDLIQEFILWLFYLFASCGGFIFFIIQYKNYFKRAE
jgi:hypothetical protein